MVDVRADIRLRCLPGVDLPLAPRLGRRGGIDYVRFRTERNSPTGRRSIRLPAAYDA